MDSTCNNSNMQFEDASVVSFQELKDKYSLNNRNKFRY